MRCVVGCSIQNPNAVNQEASSSTRGDEGATAPPATEARGDVVINAQRQQLMGVRLVAVTRDAVAAVVRTTGIVHYDETRQTDVNVKLDGWIRQLSVNYTGQFVKEGEPLFSLYESRPAHGSAWASPGSEDPRPTERVGNRRCSQVRRPRR